MNKKNNERRYHLYSTTLLIVSLLLTGIITSCADQEPGPGGLQPGELIPGDQDLPQPEQGVENGTYSQGLEQGKDNPLVPIEHGGVALWYDPQVILQIEGSTIPRTEGGMDEPHPAYVQFALPMDSGAISVVEIEVYKNMSDVAASAFPDLQALISSHNLNYLECIPELPLVAFFHDCSHQQLNANLEFIDFQNGSGLRFVTVYAIQDAVPVSNEHLVYIFQGVTNDQQCYLKAGFRLLHQDLQDYDEIPSDIYADPSGTALSKYFSRYEQQLTGTPEGFSPALTHFDLIISSLEISNCLGG